MQYVKNLDLSFEKVTKDIVERYKFDCGNDYINKCYKKSIKTNETTDFVFIDNNKDKLVAYYSLNCSSIMIDSNSSLINLVPAVEIKTFALDKDYHGMLIEKDSDDKLSDFILDMVREKISYFINEHCGAGRIVLYSVPEAYNFYKRFGFNDFIDLMKPAGSKATEDCIPMFFNL